jgi:undecaprenyl diphosphate synthase
MDGNGRWAKQNGLSRFKGHEKGVGSVREVTEACTEIGVKYLTLYAFSTENWNRPKEEVDALMTLLVSSLKAELNTFMKNKIRLRAVGNLESLPEACQLELAETMKMTETNDQLDLVLALSYSSTWEITNAAKRIATKVKNNELKIEDINSDVFAQNLTTAGIPDPELMIRTSGEVRISNFLLWQLAYSELYFTDILWPEFGKVELYKAIINYQQRERRFGKTSEQINSDSDQTI